MGIKNILFIFPVMGYFLLESLISAVFVSFAWKFFLSPTFDIQISYIQWVVIIWIIKVVFFDVFKLISSLTEINNRQNNNQNRES